MLIIPRDDFVDIIVDNINDPEKVERNFAKKNPANVLDFGPYDFGSVMHYRATAFLKEELEGTNKKTIVGKVS